MQMVFTHPQTLEIPETGFSHTVPHNDLQEIQIIFGKQEVPKKANS